MARRDTRRGTRSARPRCESLEGRRLLATFTVGSGDDSGPGSLREAILAANATPGTDAIVFAPPPGGPLTIRPTSALPAISEPLSMTGGGRVVLDGSLAGEADGLTITSGNSLIRGMTIARFDGNGLVLRGRGGNVLLGNALGADPSGASAMGNDEAGLLLDGSPNNTIGGSEPGQGNVISGNRGDGIRVVSATAGAFGGRNQIQGNAIGTDPSGTLDVNNGGAGIRLETVENLVGAPLVPGAAGPSLPQFGNRIAFNIGDGVVVGTPGGLVGQPSAPASGNLLTSNMIYRNGGLGINAAPSASPSKPSLASAFNFTAGGATSTQVVGAYSGPAGSLVTLEFFSSVTPDPIEGEGQTPLFRETRVVGPDGTARIDMRFPEAAREGLWVTATATDASGNTSEFSNAVLIQPQDAADLGVLVTVPPTPLTTARGVGTTLTVGNNGPATAEDVVLTLDVQQPTGAAILGAVPSLGQPIINGDVVTVELGDLAPGAQATLSVSVRVADPAQFLATAAVNSASTFDPMRSNNTAEILAPDGAGPLVQNLRIGVSTASVENLVIFFNEPLDPTSAELPNNYSIRLRGKDGRFGTTDDANVPLDAARYDAATRSVSIVPARPLPLGQFYQIVVNPPRAPGLTDRSGNLVDGDANGLPDGQYVAMFGRGTHIRPLNYGPGVRGRFADFGFPGRFRSNIPSRPGLPLFGG